MEERFQKIERSVQELTLELHSVGDLIAAGFTKVNTNFESISKEIKNLHNQIEIINKKIDQLQGNTTEGLQNVGLRLETLTEEISKISVVTKYGDYYDNMKAIK